MLLKIDDTELLPIEEEARLRRYADGFFRDHYQWLQVRAIHFCNRHPRYSMEDALTEAWLKLPRILGKYQPEISLVKTFVAGQLKWYWLANCYKWVNVEEKLDRFVYVKDYYEPLMVGIRDVMPDIIDIEDERAIIPLLIKLLTPKSRTILTLRYIGNMTMQEMADYIGCAKSMVHVYIHAALAELSPIVEAKYGNSITKVS